MNQIILHGMSKSFGKKNVIKAQNACFSPGQIYGIVGQNGCGKTVLFKCMSGLMPTTSGRIEIQLDDPAQKARPYCGVVIDGAGFNDSLSGLSNLVALADITKKADKKAIASLMASVGLSPDNRKKVRYYSLGMRQRLAIAQAIMEDPAILLLDEPLNGLDYEGVKTVYDILKVQKERGKIILVASHHEEDIRLLCDEVYWLKDGILERIEDISEYTRFKEDMGQKRKNGLRNCKRFQTVQSSRFTTCMFDFKSSQGIQCGLVVYSWGAEALCLRACHVQTILL